MPQVATHLYPALTALERLKEYVRHPLTRGWNGGALT